MEILSTVYGKGFLYSLVATVLFACFDWIIIERKRRLYVIPLVAFLLWTIMYFAGSLIWTFVLLFGAMTFGIGVLIGFGICGYLLLKIIIYVMPERWASFTSDEFHLFIIGAFYLITYSTLN